MAADKTGPIGMTGTPRRDLIIGGGSFVCLAKILPPTVLANAAEPEGSADSRIISGSEAIVPVSVEAGEVLGVGRRHRGGPFPLSFFISVAGGVLSGRFVVLGVRLKRSSTVPRRGV